jgi:hypothetical protein
VALYAAYGSNIDPEQMLLRCPTPPQYLDPMLTFTGALQDTVGGTTPGTGFVHLGKRWYRPPVEPNAGVRNETGPAHFTQPDSMQQLASPANANLYAYAADSPTNFIDPTGNDWHPRSSPGREVSGSVALSADVSLAARTGGFLAP